MLSMALTLKGLRSALYWGRMRECTPWFGDHALWEVIVATCLFLELILSCHKSPLNVPEEHGVLHSLAVLVVVLFKAAL